jgi:putative redox protein
MVTVKEKTVVTYRFTAEATTHSRTDVKVRDVSSVIDEPLERGGTNQGLAPTETLMASLLGCTNTIFHKCANKHGVKLHKMSMRLEGQLDRRGVTLQEEVDVPFPKMTMYVDIVTDAPEAAIEAAKTDLRRFCAVSKVIRACGTNLEEVWTVTRP